MDKTPVPPLTRRASGSTRCPACGKRFADTPGMGVTETEGQVENLGRIDSIGQRHRGHGTHAERRRWHEECLRDFEASNEAYRAQVREDQRQMVVTLCEGSGIDPTPYLVRFDAETRR